MRYPILIWLLFSIAFTGTAKTEDEDYAAKNIPAYLLKGANAVMRYETKEINILSDSDIEITERYAVTILNEEGKEHGVITARYDKMKSVVSIEGNIYDVNGTELGKVKKSAIQDIGFSTEAFFDDIRYKYFQFNYNTYPYTCVYEVVTRINSSFIVPGWQPQPKYDCAVEKASYVVHYPKDMPVRYRTYNMKHSPVVTTEDGAQKLSISIDSVVAHANPDELLPAGSITYPEMRFVIDDVTMPGYKGYASTWNGLGDFVYRINANRDALPSSVAQYVHQLTDTCTTTYSKVSLLYKYLGQSTHYVNIRLGIGGWQTLDARFVGEKGYGDCKALSNYMKALLKEANVTSYQVMIDGGTTKERVMEQDFPCSEFNHVILCVPDGKDTIWLDGTDKDIPPGYMPSFTNDRNALMLTPSGGYVVKTPSYDAKENILARNVSIDINEQDEIHGSINELRQGMWWDNERYFVKDAKTKKDNVLNSRYAIPTYTVGDYTITNKNDFGIPVITETIPISGSGNISRSGDHIFLSPRVLSFSIPAPASGTSRKDSFELAHDYQVCDTTTITLTGAYVPDALPKDINADLPFASYHTRVTFEGDKTLRIIVHYRQKEGVYPPALFADYVKLSKQINSNAAYSKVMLHKKV